MAVVACIWYIHVVSVVLGCCPKTPWCVESTGHVRLEVKERGVKQLMPADLNPPQWPDRAHEKRAKGGALQRLPGKLRQAPKSRTCALQSLCIAVRWWVCAGSHLNEALGNVLKCIIACTFENA